jgi:hypothetical protein
MKQINSKIYINKDKIRKLIINEDDNIENILKTIKDYALEDVEDNEKAQATISLKYEDDEKELISFSTETDFKYAIKNHNEKNPFRIHVDITTKEKEKKEEKPKVENNENPYGFKVGKNDSVLDITNFVKNILPFPYNNFVSENAQTIPNTFKTDKPFDKIVTHIVHEPKKKQEIKFEYPLCSNCKTNCELCQNWLFFFKF